jgi:hypothetical protein
MDTRCSKCGVWLHGRWKSVEVLQIEWLVTTSSDGTKDAGSGTSRHATRVLKASRARLRLWIGKIVGRLARRDSTLAQCLAAVGAQERWARAKAFTHTFLHVVAVDNVAVLQRPTPLEADWPSGRESTLLGRQSASRPLLRRRDWCLARREPAGRRAIKQPSHRGGFAQRPLWSRPCYISGRRRRRAGVEASSTKDQVPQSQLFRRAPSTRDCSSRHADTRTE